ncbi:MAG: WG repeat-containing protein [Ferruginibacter sp.]
MKYFYKAIMPAGTHRKWFKLIFLIAAFLSLKTAAQTKTINDATQIIKTGEVLKDIFKKKKNKPQAVSTRDSNVTTDNSVNDSLSTSKKNISIKAGDIAPNAKYIDVDEMGYFSMGVARVRKGTKTALIDTGGNFIVPFGKFSISKTPEEFFDAEGETPVNHGFFLANSVTLEGYDYAYGVLNSKGKFFSFLSVGGISDAPFECAGYISLRDKSGNVVYMDAMGNIFKLKRQLASFSEDIGVSFETDNTGFHPTKLEYKNMNDHVIIKPKYDEAKAFREDRAIVGIEDEFGQMKYAFIDKTGREITPFIYSRLPENFSCGLAKVTPKNNSEFNYAYINKEGKIKIKHTAEDANKYGSFGSFVDGYAYSYKNVMDTTGKIISKMEWQNKLGIKSPYRLTIATDWSISLNTFFYSKGKLFYAQNRTYPSTKLSNTGWGFIDLDKNKVIDAVFSTETFHFDKIAKLSYAKMIIGYDTTGGQNKEIIREGYINEDGVFVIVMAAKSSW